MIPAGENFGWVQNMINAMLEIMPIKYFAQIISCSGNSENFLFICRKKSEFLHFLKAMGSDWDGTGKTSTCLLLKL
jgi:hypothetical protein